jgi:peroxiredoxin
MPDQFVLTVRSPAPEFSLPASTGSEISLSEYRNKNNVYLFFVREFN